MSAGAVVGPCPAWCVLTPWHGWDSRVGDDGRLARLHQGPDFGGEVATYAVEYADAGGHREALTIEEHTDRVHTPAEARTLAECLREAAEWVQKVEADQRWWRTTTNPPCMPWCEADHDPKEVSKTGLLACRRDLSFSRGRVDVYQVTIPDERIGGDPGAFVVDPATVEVVLDADQADIDGQLYLAESLGDLASGLTGALAEAQALLGGVTLKG